MAKKKAVNVKLIPEKDEDGKTHKLYAMMHEIIVEHHDHLAQAKVALAWNSSWSEDVDGRLVLGKCKKVGDLDKEFHDYDFVIQLNIDAMKTMSAAQRTALIDHELCHAAVKLDTKGEPCYDERDRIVYRMRKHTIEEFHEIVARHGMYKSDIASFVKIALLAAKNPLLETVSETTGEVAQEA